MGFFVVFEGSDGAGKSTQLKILAAELAALGISVVCTREPGGTSVGDAVREVMLGKGSVDMQPLTWAFLMNAARAELASQVIRPALARNQVVLSDRYWYSTLAYQSAGDGVPAETVTEMADIATSGLEPDLVLLLQLPPETGLSRKRHASRNVLDERPLDFHVRVSDAYREMARTAGDRWQTFDATRPVEDVTAAILSKVLAHPALASSRVPTSR